MSVETTGTTSSPQEETPKVYRWYHKLSGVLLAIFCFEMGAFLIVFPWMDAWRTNYFAYLTPQSYESASLASWWRELWLSPHFRGAISGLGVVNIYVSLLEVFRLRRFSTPEE